LSEPGAIAIAGGTDLLPRLKNETVIPKRLVDLNAIESLKDVQISPERVRLGAGTRLAELMQHTDLAIKLPALLKAMAHVASPQIRNVATLGGNLCQFTRCQYFNQSFHWRKSLSPCYKTDGDVCHQRKRSSRCVASFYSDIAPVLIAMGAKVVLTGHEGNRIISLDRMYLDDGNLSLGVGELVSFIDISLKKHQGQVYLGRALRSTIDFGLGIVAAVISVDPHKELCQEAAIVLGGVAPFPLRAEKAENLLLGQKLSGELITEASRLAVEGLEPIPEPFCTPKYKKQLMEVLIKRAIKQAYDEALGNLN
ncbi:MAG: FAD binding domain-containing protein, partial [Dehalobacterium sp.]